MNVYRFTVKRTNQEEVSLSKYKGKVLLIVNTATGCGFTPQYEGLEALYQEFKNQGFEVLDFPCNQFLNQAPGSDEEVSQFCKLNYGTTFETFAKIHVNGKDAHPLYQFLREQAPDDNQDEGLSKFQQVLQKLKQTVSGNAIKWNFTKFLIDREGKVVARFNPTVKPVALKEVIQKTLR